MPRKPVDSPPLPGNPDPMGQISLLAHALKLANNDEWPELTLIAKLARISGYVGMVEKRGYNAFHKYHYVTEGDLVGAVRGYLAASDIIIIPNCFSVTRDGDLTTVMVEYTVTSGQESITFQMPGQGSDRGDKGVYKAVTGSMKYALMKLFKIETGDDPEGDTRTDERAATTPPARQVSVTAGDRTGVERGGHTTNASPVQIRRVNERMKELGWERTNLVDAIKTVLNKDLILPEDDKAAGEAVLAFLRGQSTIDVGSLLSHMVEQGLDEEALDRSAADYG